MIFRRLDKKLLQLSAKELIVSQNFSNFLGCLIFEGDSKLMGGLFDTVLDCLNKQIQNQKDKVSFIHNNPCE